MNTAFVLGSPRAFRKSPVELGYPMPVDVPWQLQRSLADLKEQRLVEELGRGRDREPEGERGPGGKRGPERERGPGRKRGPGGDHGKGRGHGGELAPGDRYHHCRDM